MTNTTPDSPEGIYHPWAIEWFRSGFQPLPVVGKAISLPEGFTGYQGRLATLTDVVGWQFERPDDNIALRANGWVGIDVDHYTKGTETKTGGLTLALAEQAWGALPPTWRITARDGDPISGIRLYRVPEGDPHLETVVKLADDNGELHSDIEIIQWSHRYAVTWPSIHPDLGLPYRLYRPDGTLADTNELPTVASLPWLPDGWLAGLHREPKDPSLARDPVAVAAQRAPMDAWHQRVKAHWSEGITACGGAAGSRHDAMGVVLGRLARDEERRRAGATRAIEDLRTVFVRAVDRHGADDEFDRMVDFSRHQAASTRSTLAEPGTVDIPIASGAGQPEAQAPIPMPPRAELPDWFWDTRPLAHIRTEANLAGVNPISAVIGALARINTILSPRWQTGRARGIEPGSLNLYVASVCPPGDGKSRMAGLVRRLVPAPVDMTRSEPAAWFRDGVRPGSAAGLAAIFEQPEPEKEDDPIPPRTWSAWLEYDEGSALLDGPAKRNGEPMVAELCTAWIGAELSTVLRHRSDSRHVPAHSYGLGLLLNLQTKPAIELLRTEGIGLPQRFLWVDAAPTGDWDPDAWGEDIRPVEPIPWHRPARTPTLGIHNVFTLPEVALRDLHALTNPDRERPEDPLDVHHPYLRHKVACGLAKLHERDEVADEDWVRAGYLVESSAQVRRAVQAAADAERARDAEAQRQAQAQAVVATKQAVADEQRRRLQTVLDGIGCGISRRELLKRYNASYRPEATELLERLIGAGVVAETELERGSKWLTIA